MLSMPVILLSNYYPKGPLEIIQSVVPKGFELVTLETYDRELLKEKALQTDYILASGRQRIDQEILDKAPKVKMIQRTGVGLDSLDLDYIHSINLPIYVNKGVNAISVAEHTLMLMLSTLKKLPNVHQNMLAGIWNKQQQGVLNYELSGKTVGLIGMGSIGKKVAQMLKGFQVKVFYFSRTKLTNELEEELEVNYCSLEDLIRKVDILSLHSPLNKDTHHLIDEAELKRMKPGAIIINTARGDLINEEALIKYLSSGQIGAAGLDVFKEEPLPKTSPLLKLENVILTPHISGVTYDSFFDMMSSAMENIRLFEEGQYQQIESRRLKP